MHLKTITELLALRNVKVVGELIHTENRLNFYVDLIDPVGPICSACGVAHHTPVHSTDWVRVEDIAISGKRVFLSYPKRRARCPKDGKIRSELLDWTRSRFTRRFAEQVYRLTSVTMNVEG
jgi:transposase